MPTFIHRAPTAILAAIAIWTASAAPVAAQRIEAELGSSQGKAQPQIAVEGSGSGRRITATQLTLDLALSARMSPEAGAHRLVTSELFVKADGAATGTLPLAGLTSGTRAFTQAGKVSFPLDPLGPLARSAVTLCASGSDRSILTVPLVWRLTSGRIDFAALAAAGIAPTESTLSDPDLYGARETQEVEGTVQVPVRCEASAVAAAPSSPGAPSAASKAIVKPIPPTGRVHEARLVPAVVPADGSRVAEPAESPASEPDKPAAISCSGGIVREFAGGAEAACLCPGHTAKRQTGASSYVCDRRLARKR